MATKQIFVAPNKCALKKIIPVSNIVGYCQSQCGFHNKRCPGITINVLCPDSTVSN